VLRLALKSMPLLLDLTTVCRISVVYCTVHRCLPRALVELLRSWMSAPPSYSNFWQQKLFVIYLKWMKREMSETQTKNNSNELNNNDLQNYAVNVGNNLWTLLRYCFVLFCFENVAFCYLILILNNNCLFMQTNRLY
jgi:hypothetical protein